MTRCFAWEGFDLIRRIADSGDFIGFDLCYETQGDKHTPCRIAVWDHSHVAVDSGEILGCGYKHDIPTAAPT